MTDDQRLILPTEMAAAPGSSTLQRLLEAMVPPPVVAVVPGWATVEMERAAAELASDPRLTDLPGDPILGARCRQLLADGRTVVLLEPSTEGRLAGALARHGEGWVAAYLVVTGCDGAVIVKRLAEAGVRLSAAAPGPLGPERLVLGGPRDGPFELLACGP